METHIRNQTQEYIATSDADLTLVDVWLVVRKRWLWLLLGTIVGVAAAIAYVVSVTPVYESHASFQIGSVTIDEKGNRRLIDDVDALVITLLESYGSTSRDIPTAAYLKQVDRSGNLLKLVVAAHSPQDAKVFLSQIVSESMARQDHMYRKAAEPLQHTVSVLDGQVKVLKIRVSNFQKMIDRFQKMIDRLRESHPLQASMLVMEQGQLYMALGQLESLEKDRVIMLQQAVVYDASPSKVIKSATLPTVPVIPRKVRSMGAGVALGLLLSLAAVFLVELFARMKVRL